jgi:hypothetical protein
VVAGVLLNLVVLAFQCALDPTFHVLMMDLHAELGFRALRLIRVIKLPFEAFIPNVIGGLIILV